MWANLLSNLAFTWCPTCVAGVLALDPLFAAPKLAGGGGGGGGGDQRWPRAKQLMFSLPPG